MSTTREFQTTSQYATVRAERRGCDFFVKIGNSPDEGFSINHGQYFDAEDLKEFIKFLKGLRRELKGAK